MSATLKDGQLSLRRPNDLKDKLEVCAQLTVQTKSYVAMEALGAYFKWRIPQIEDLKVALMAADEADFATDAEVSAVLAKHTLRKLSRVAAKATAQRRAA